jgi:plasmid stabilization system protein ParE
MVVRPQFLVDIEDCADYLHTEADEAVAELWRKEFKRAVALIQKHPELGRLRHDLPIPGIRTLNLRKYPAYLIFYRLQKGKLEMLRIRHGMMHLPALFSD